ncbi:MAG: four helix bundle protein [Thermoanaerobaculaceae bacterium]|jgi:four helix bundle protein
MQRFTELQVWQRSHAAVLEIYRVTRQFPASERYGITAQLRRAAVSAPTNIAEGAKRSSRKDYAHFLNIAEGSLAETEYLVLLSRDLKYLPMAEADTLLAELAEIMRMLAGLRRKVEEKQ